jgi:glycosyltransferase involved in cell wall biosynthesis
VLTFSIVLPNFNSGAVLERCIQSLLAQDYEGLQLIMADGGSTDESREIIERHRDRFDVVISEPDDGQADGINKGFAHATGDIVGWLCADDELLPGALKHVAETFETQPDADVVNGACERHYPDGSTVIYTPVADPWSVITIKDVIEQPSTFWRRALHERLAPLKTDYYMAFDWDLWIRMRNSGAKVVTTDRVLSRYYFTWDNKCGRAGNRFADEGFRIIRQYGPLGGRLANVYRFLYYHFDLKGCFDRPVTCSRFRWLVYWGARAVLRLFVGRRLLNMYNWHFAACQERGLKWWE